MSKKRFQLEQNGTYHTVIDTVKNVPLIMLEFKENEFGAYACFHSIIDMLNEFYEENQQLKLKNDGLEYALKNIKKIDVEIDINDWENIE